MSVAVHVSVAALAGLAAALLALALLAAVFQVRVRLAPVVVRLAGIALAGAGLAVALGHLVLGGAGGRLAVPFPVAGLAPVLALDGLSAFVLVALLPVAVAWLAIAPTLAGVLPGVLALTGAAMLSVLAADSGTLALGVAVAGLAALGLARGHGLAWVVASAVPALVVALALAAGDGRFAAVRAHPAEGGALWLMLALLLAAGGGLAALAPAHRWPGRVGEHALAHAVLATLGLYLLARGMLDLAGPLAAGWAAPLVLAGAAGAVLGGLAAVRAEGLRGVVAGLGVARSGLVALGLGMVVAARAVDDGPAASLALGAALFLMAVLGWAQALAGLVAHGLARGAGSQELGRLGGLVHRMRFTAIGALAGGLAVAMLPPGAGFAGLWLLLRAAVTLPRGGGAAWWAMAALAALSLGLAAALLGYAVLRVLGVAFLGRPRSPHAAAAEEVAPALRWTMLGFSALLVLCGLLPGLVLALAAPAVAPLAGAAAPGGMLAVMGYAPLGIALLLALAGAAVALLVRLSSPSGHRVAPAWEGGQPPAPTWLPFGDPATQLGASGFAANLARHLAWRPPAWPAFGGARWTALANRMLALPRRAGPALAMLLLVAMLVLHGVGAW